MRKIENGGIVVTVTTVTIAYLKKHHKRQVLYFSSIATSHHARSVDYLSFSQITICKIPNYDSKESWN